MDIKRRSFLKMAGCAGAGLVAAKPAAAKPVASSTEFYGVLVDTTLCAGCRGCEDACRAKNGLPEPQPRLSDDEVFLKPRNTSTGAYTVLNRFENPKDKDSPVFVRKQCFHCNQPACATACLVKALEKTPEGPVVYHKDRCMGCRYCMVACPFDVPKYEYSSPAPYLRKCQFCFDKVKEGQAPACVEACPMEASIFGKRRELLEIARTRIHGNPGKYVNHIYGEHEVGGTAFMFIYDQPFDKIGMRTDLGATPYPEHTAGFLYSVPLVFVLWPALLTGLNALTARKEENHDR